MDTFLNEAAALAAVQAHALCAQYMETPGSYVVFYPAAYVIPGGTSVPKSANALADLTTLYGRLQDFWNAQRLQVSAQ